jgi:hypothetical protein
MKSIGIVNREELFADTKLGKYIVQLLIMSDGTGNASQMMQTTANI